MTQTQQAAPAVGTKVKLNRLVSYEKPRDLESHGVVVDHQTKRVVTVRWEDGPHVGAHQTIRIDRLDVL